MFGKRLVTAELTYGLETYFLMLL